MSDGLVFSKFGHFSTNKPLSALSVDQATTRTHRIENIMANKKLKKYHILTKQQDKLYIVCLAVESGQIIQTKDK